MWPLCVVTSFKIFEIPKHVPCLHQVRSLCGWGSSVVGRGSVFLITSMSNLISKHNTIPEYCPFFMCLHQHTLLRSHNYLCYFLFLYLFINFFNVIILTAASFSNFLSGTDKVYCHLIPVLLLCRIWPISGRKSKSSWSSAIIESHTGSQPLRVLRYTETCQTYLWNTNEDLLHRWEKE